MKELADMREQKQKHGVPSKIEGGPLYADGFDAALIGHLTREGCEVAVYDYQECVAVIMQDCDLSWEDAVDHMEFNVAGSYVGKRTPIFYYFTEEEE